MIYIYDGRGTSTPLHTLNLHTKPVTFIKVLLCFYFDKKYNHVLENWLNRQMNNPLCWFLRSFSIINLMFWKKM